MPVWHPAAADAVYLCRRFELPAIDAEQVPEAWLYCASNGLYEVRVNGHPAGRGLGGALTDLPVWNRCDIREHLLQGDNLIVVRACGVSPSAVDPWFMADGGIRIGSLTTLELTTGDTWDVRALETSDLYRSGPKPWHGVVPGEGGWARPSTVAEGGAEPVLWSPPRVGEEEALAVEVVAFGEVRVDEDLASIAPGPFTTCKCLNREALLSPGKRDTVMRGGPPDRAVCIIMDFGRPITGFPRLRLKPGAPCTIEVGFSVDLRSVGAVLKYVSGGGGEDWLGPHPQYGRYLIMRIGDVAEDVVVDCASMIERRADVDSAGEVSSPDRLAALYRIGRRSLSTRGEVYRRLYQPRNWLLEHVLALGDYYVDGGGSRAAAVLQSSEPPDLSENDPAPLLAYLLFLDAHAWYHGSNDTRQAELVATKALGLIDDCRHLCRADGLLDTVSADFDFSALNALYGGALAAVLRLCRSSGDVRSASSMSERFVGVKSALQTVWSGDRGLFADGTGSQLFSQWTNGLLLYFGLVESEQRVEVLRGLRGADVALPDNLLQTFFLVGGLWRSGESELALNQMERHWGRVADRDGSTWSEKWDRGVGDEVPGPEYFLGSEVLGIRPASPGYETVEVAPRSPGLVRTEGTVPTGRGKIQVTWTAGETFHLRLSRSEMGRTNVRVPRRGRRFPTVTVNREPVWRNEKFYPNSVAREVISEEEEIVLVTEGCGPYEIEAG